MSNTTSHQTGSNTPTPSTLVKIDIASDVIILGVALVYLFVDRVIRPLIGNRINKAFRPIEDERRLSDILAQIGIILDSSRVILAAFHNGEITTSGYHLQKVSTINFYIAPGEKQVVDPIKDLPITRIMNELQPLLKTNDWVDMSEHMDFPDTCKYYLQRNNIEHMKSKLIRVGNLPIGILSVQYSRGRCSDKDSLCYQEIPKKYESILDDLYNEIVLIMEKRVIHPSPVRRIFGTIIGTLSIK